MSETDKFDIYGDKLAVLNNDFNRRFGDFDELEKTLLIVKIQLKLIDLRCDKTLQEICEKEELSVLYNPLNTEQLKNIRKFAI